MKVVIAGAAGLVGRHFAARLSGEHEVLALTRLDLDITDRAAVERRLQAVQPSLIINCAVLQVDESEEHPAKARAVNAEGPGYLAEAANSVGAELIQFSTQYTFDGEPVGRPPYTELDEPRPVNTYGRTKVAGEGAVRAACRRSFIVRTAWVFGSGKNNFLCAVHKQLRAGNRVQAIGDIWSSATYVEDLIDRTLEIRSDAQYGTYHVVNEGVCTYHEFALEAGRLLGIPRRRLDGLIEAVKERDLDRTAARPPYTPLRCLRSEELRLPPMRHWRNALAAYIAHDA